MTHAGFIADQAARKLRQPGFGRLPVEALVRRLPEVAQGIAHAHLRETHDKLQVLFQRRRRNAGSQVLVVEGVGVVVNMCSTLHEGRYLAGQVALVDQCRD